MFPEVDRNHAITNVIAIVDSVVFPVQFSENRPHAFAAFYDNRRCGKVVG